MTLTAAQKNIYERAGKTFVQTALPSLTAAYARASQHQAALVWPGLEAGAIASAAAALSVLWNGLTTLVGAHRAKQLKRLADAIDKAVAEALATQTPIASR